MLNARRLLKRRATMLKAFNFLRFCSSSVEVPATLNGMRLAALLAELRVFRIAK